MKKSQNQKVVQNNLVAKHMEQFNRPGYTKYKNHNKGDQY